MTATTPLQRVFLCSKMRTIEDVKRVYEKYRNSNYPLKESNTQTHRDSYVYLIFCEITNLYKIGISDNPRERKRNLECAIGVSLDFASVYECKEEIEESAETVESLFHTAFASKRSKRGEWFSFSKRDLYLAACLIGELDLEDVTYHFNY